MAAKTAALAPVVPFTGAAHSFRRLYATQSATIGASTTDVSPAGNEIFSYGYLRAHLTRVSTTTAASTGGTLSADGVWGMVGNMQIRQPGGQQMFGGPNFTGFLAYLANKQSAWKLVTDPAMLPSFTNATTNPAFALRAIFELNVQTGLGSLPNQNDAAAWQIQMTAPANTTAYQTNPTTTNPTLKYQHYIECWTVPSPQNPLRPNVRQMTAPPLLGTLNKWTVQQLVVPGGSNFDAAIVRKGNSLRNLGLIAYNSSNARLALASAWPNPLTVEWDGTLIRSNDDPNLFIDDEYMVRGGAASPASASLQTPDVGVLWLKQSDPAGIDVSGLGLDGLGMSRQWGTTQTSNITFGGTWQSGVAYIYFLTNDVQYVIPSPNPYALAAGQPYLTNAAQPSGVGG
jgi:hypothetical protein